MSKGCTNCRFEGIPGNAYPCSKCNRDDPTMWESAEKLTDNPYWTQIEFLAMKQRLKGMSKYGKGLESNPLSILERLTYLEEELIDGLMYIEHIKAYIMDKEKIG